MLISQMFKLVTPGILIENNEDGAALAGGIILERQKVSLNASR